MMGGQGASSMLYDGMVNERRDDGVAVQGAQQQEMQQLPPGAEMDLPEAHLGSSKKD